MSTRVAKMTPERAVSVLEEIEAAFFDIPFENSAFQTRAFVVAGQITPARAYRTLGLGMMSKIRAIQTSLIATERRTIKEAQLKDNISSAEEGSYDQQLLQLDLQELQQGKAWDGKLLNDALSDLNVMYTEFKRIPAYTRQQFEAEEQEHFEQKLTRDVQGIRGAAEALTNMRADMPNWDELLATAELDKRKLIEW